MTHRNGRYLAYIRGRACLIGGEGTRGVEACHVRSWLPPELRDFRGGMGLKPSDYLTLPLGMHWHHMQHVVGERSFWAARAVDPLRAVCFCLMGHVGDRDTVVGILEAVGGPTEPGAMIRVLIDYIERKRPERFRLPVRPRR